MNGVSDAQAAHQRMCDLRVIKRLAPDRDGAKRLARRFGSELVCVRHRLSPDGTLRYTTVEMLVECAPIASRAEAIVQIRIGYRDKATRATAMAAGASWDAGRRVWSMPRRVARTLGLLVENTSKQG